MDDDSAMIATTTDHNATGNTVDTDNTVDSVVPSAAGAPPAGTAAPPAKATNRAATGNMSTIRTMVALIESSSSERYRVAR